MEEETIESLSKKSYELGRKLFELKVAKEITKEPEKRKQLNSFIENTTRELKRVLWEKAQLKLEMEEGKKK